MIFVARDLLIFGLKLHRDRCVAKRFAIKTLHFPFDFILRFGVDLLTISLLLVAVDFVELERGGIFVVFSGILIFLGLKGRHWPGLTLFNTPYAELRRRIDDLQMVKESADRRADEAMYAKADLAREKAKLEKELLSIKVSNYNVNNKNNDLEWENHNLKSHIENLSFRTDRALEFGPFGDDLPIDAVVETIKAEVCFIDGSGNRCTKFISRENLQRPSKPSFPRNPNFLF